MILVENKSWKCPLFDSSCHLGNIVKNFFNQISTTSLIFSPSFCVFTKIVLFLRKFIKFLIFLCSIAQCSLSCINRSHLKTGNWIFYCYIGEGIVAFPQCIASNNYFIQFVLWVISDETYLNYQKLFQSCIFGIFCHYRLTWPPVQNIPLEAVHCGKATIPSLLVHSVPVIEMKNERKHNKGK